MTTTRGYQQTPVSSSPAGYKTELDIRLLDTDNLPDGLQAERVRILNADDVYNSLAAIYIPSGEAG